MSETTSTIRDAIRDVMAAQAAELIRSNADQLASELAQSTKLSVSLSFKLVVLGEAKVNGKAKIGWIRKFHDEDEFLTKDPNQPELPGGGE